MYRGPNHEELENRIQALEQEVLQLKNENERYKIYRTFFQSTREPAGMADLEGNIAYANQALCDLLGKRDILETNVREYYSDDDRRILETLILPEVLKQGFQLVELSLRSIDGTEHPVRQSIFRIDDEQGNPQYFANVISDIEHHKKEEARLEYLVKERTRDLEEINEKFQQELIHHKEAEKALRESEERFRVLFQGAPDAIILADPDTGQIIDANPAASRMLLRSHEEILTLHQSQLHPQDSEFYSKTTFHEHVQQTQQNIPSTPFENFFKRPDGSTIPVEVMAQLIYLQGRPVLQGLFRDMTKRKQAEEKRLHLEGQLQQAQKMKAIASLAGGVAHEFNNALSTISGNIDLLEMELSDSEEIGNRIEPMKNSTRRMARLTNQLLAYARGGKYQPKNISLPHFVEETLPIIKHAIHKKIRVETDLPHDILPVEADTIQLQMVLTGIISNSSEAIEGKGRIRIVLRNQDVDDVFIKDHPSLVPGPYVCLTVKDDGKGMDGETKNNIFAPFFSTKYQGRGLGMAAVYGIVKNHDGWIAVDSDMGKGTSVLIYLPATKEPIKQIKDRQKELIKGAGNILLIEDEEAVMEVSREFLDMMGYHVLCAKTGNEAVHIAKSFDGEIDLAILDMIVPDMGSKDIYAFLQEARPQLKVLVCSGYSLEGPAQEMLDNGAQGFIQKPFSAVELSEKVNSILGEK